MDTLHINWPEWAKLNQENAAIGHEIMSLNGKHLFDVGAVGRGLLKGFPTCFAQAKVGQAVPWSLMREHALTAWLEREGSRLRDFKSRYRELAGEAGDPEPSNCTYHMVLWDTCGDFGVPYAELALTEQTAKQISIPLITDPAWVALKTGDQITYKGAEYIVVENMGVTGDAGSEILSIAPVESIDMAA